MSKHFVLDSNILIHDNNAVTSFDEHHVVIPMIVLQELDKIKSQDRDCSREARASIRLIENIIGDASHEEILAGVPLNRTIVGKPDTAKLAIFPDHITDFSGSEYIQNPINDDIIINVALKMQNDGVDVVLVSNDINMRLKAKGCGLNKVESYSTDKTIDDVDLLPAGNRKLDFDFWEVFNDKVDTSVVNYRTYYHVDPTHFPEDLIINEYLFDDTGSVFLRVDRYENNKLVLEDILYDKLFNKNIWGINPKDQDQAFAVHSLMDNNIDLSILLGSAGTGKTLLTIAAALEQVFEKKLYDRIIISRSSDSQFADIGFLPGTEEQKTAPLLGGVYDSLEFLHKNDEKPQSSIEFLLDTGQLQFKALNFIRGRSFQDTILIIDEAQNLTPTMCRTILSRAGQNCKVIFLGNLAQIDNKFITPLSSGLTYVVEKTKEYEGASVVIMKNVIRSRLAAFVEDNL